MQAVWLAFLFFDQLQNNAICFELVVIVNTGLEHILGHAAQRTAPVIRKI